MREYFSFKGILYAKNTVVEIYENKRNDFGFCQYLVFYGYDEETKLCHFHTLYDKWKQFAMTEDQLEECIEKIETPYALEINTGPKVDPNYIDGIVSAWIWYILIMFFALFLKGIENVIGIWALASGIFFSWRRKKMNGE